MGEGRVGELYSRLKEMAVSFQFRPGERINEVALARKLDASRTPLREALNRLVAEQLVDFRSGQGFFCRDLDAGLIFELYEMREILETAATRRACERAADEDVMALRDDLYGSGLAFVGKTIPQVTETDEHFHVSIARLAGNGELVRQLVNINERIRFIRWIDMSSRVMKTKGEHKGIMAAIVDRDADRAVRLMQAHITKRMDQIVAAVREGFSNIYVPGAGDLFTQEIDEREG
ncbi:MAG: GntR family transcriptional regulator [Paracoccaceae bacterium]